MKPRAFKPIAEAPIKSDEDVIVVRGMVRAETQKMRLGFLDQTRFVTAVSELARNIVMHAKKGSVLISEASAGQRRGLKVVFKDGGPGITDMDRAMQEGYSTVNSLGMGLPGARRLVDEFDIESSAEGTKVTIIKWL